MLLSQIEYEILRPIYRGEPQKFDEKKCQDAIEYLLSNHMIERIYDKEVYASKTDIQYRITTLGRQAYEECLNYLVDQERKDATLKTAKKSNTISIWAISVSALSFLVSIGSLIVSILKSSP